MSGHVQVCILVCVSVEGDEKQNLKGDFDGSAEDIIKVHV